MIPTTSRSQRFDWTVYSSRLLWLALWSVLVLLTALPLIYVYVNPEPMSFDSREGVTTIHFETTRSRLFVPDQCVTLSWAVEGVKEVYIIDKGVTGQGSLMTCNTDFQPNMRVVLPDGSAHTYSLPVEKLYANAIIFGVWIALILSVTAIGYTLFGISGAVFNLTVILFWSITRLWIETGTDYIIHMQFQQIILDTGNLNALPPHPLYYFLGSSIAVLFPGMSLVESNLFVVLVAYGLGSIATYWLLQAIVGESSGSEIRQALIYVPLTLSLWCVVPLVLSGNPLNTLIGRPDIPMNMFNSPTLILLRPFAVLMFLGCAKWLTVMPERRWLAILGVAAATVAATLAKPNYTMAILPALVLVLAYQLIRPFRLNRILIIVGILLPAIMVLGWQYLRAYAAGAPSTTYNPDQSAGIALAPLQLYLIEWGFTLPQIISGFLLSIVFPVSVYIAYFKVASHNLMLNLAWLVFLIGQSFGYLFIEMRYEAAGNMTWGGRITLFVLFASSLGFLLYQNAESLLNGKSLPRDARFYICFIVYVLHLLPYLQYAHIKLG